MPVCSVILVYLKRVRKTILNSKLSDSVYPKRFTSFSDQNAVCTHSVGQFLVLFRICEEILSRIWPLELAWVSVVTFCLLQILCLLLCYNTYHNMNFIVCSLGLPSRFLSSLRAGFKSLNCAVFWLYGRHSKSIFYFDCFSF